MCSLCCVVIFPSEYLQYIRKRKINLKYTTQPRSITYTHTECTDTAHRTAQHQNIFIIPTYYNTSLLQPRADKKKLLQQIKNK